ncbi:hypothetical protein [Paenibacillus xylanexedens]|uniref:hypothetical protein n=1 Tax=Paenibacillus xylanexedens TaxID=528191 RepID=UPI000F53C272|nr:hypothetical protein [Paenibacillus xylanexedens]
MNSIVSKKKRTAAELRILVDRQLDLVSNLAVRMDLLRDVYSIEELLEENKKLKRELDVLDIFLNRYSERSKEKWT